MASKAQIPAFVISLRRTPDRRDEFFRRNGSVYPGTEIFDAVDGATISHDQAVATGVIDAGAHGYSPGAIGSAMSHRALWEQCAKGPEPIVVFEDDAVLREDFAEVLPEILQSLQPPWDIVRLGFNFDSILDYRMTDFCDLRSILSIGAPTKEQLKAFAKSRDPVRLFRLNNAFGICAYAISPRGARALLKKCFPLQDKLIDVPGLRRSFMAKGTDYMMNAAYRDLKAYIAIPPLALTANDQAKSTIQRLMPKSGAWV